jgi:low affinity Fe/Cu permease
MHAGRPTRLELYGLAFAVTVGIVHVNDQVRIQIAVQRKIVEELERPAIIQNNHQTVTVESEQGRMIRELAEQRGWKTGVNSNRPTTKTDGNASGPNDVPANR